MTAPRSAIISVLDVGSSKLCCMIARARRRDGGEAIARTHDVEVLGVGHQRSRGIRGGVVTDIAAAEAAIRDVVAAAERASGMTVGSLIVNVSSSSCSSAESSATIAVSADEIEASDVGRAVRMALRDASPAGGTVLHALATGFSIDGGDAVADPVGMLGDEVTVTCHTVSAAAQAVGNLERAVNRAHLDVASLVATPYASALAVAVEDEAEMGCAVIDLGAGTTSWSIHARGRFLCGGTLPIGAQHVTMDLARALSTPLEAAERLKVMEASVAGGPVRDEPVPVRAIGGEGSAAVARVPRALVGQVARARVEETFEMVRDRIRASGMGREADRRVILTGGGAQLTGIADVARHIIARNARVGRPLGVSGLAPMQKSPAFASAVGLLIYPQVAGLECSRERSFLPAHGPLARIGGWFKGF